MSSILIIGSANTNKFINQIVKFTSQENVNYLFEEESDLAKAYKEIDGQFNTIYLANVKDKTSYLDIAKQIDEKTYDYILPLDLFITDFIKENENSISIINLFISSINPKYTTIIFTGIHANAFYSIESFIDYNNQTINIFKYNLDCKKHGKNILYITNNLKNSQYGSIKLAVTLANTKIGVYPSGKFGEAVYDLENSDFLSGVIYYKNNVNVNSSIENFTNLYPYYPEKVHFIYLIIKYIDSKIQLDYFKGKMYDPKVTLLQIKSKIDEILFLNKGVCITDYEISNVTCVKKNYCYEITSNITIVPFFSFEKVNLELVRRL